MIFLSLSLFGVFIFFGNFNSLENKIFTNYNRYYQEIYSKTQTPESLFELFREKMTKKDKASIKTMTLPFFVSWNDQKKEESFNNFWQRYSQYNFEKAAFIIKYDTSYYFEISGAILENEKQNEIKNSEENPQKTLKIYFSRESMQHVKDKKNQFPVNDYYLLVSENK